MAIRTIVARISNAVKVISKQDEKSENGKSFSQPTGRMVARNPFSDMKAHIESPEPVIIDGGAHLGETTDEFIKTFPSCMVHAFEANPELALQFQQRISGAENVKVYSNALGAHNRVVQFHITKYDSSSSIYEPAKIGVRYNPDKLIVEAIREVQQVTIDSLFADLQIDIIKLDLQGAELEALKGSVKSLQNVKMLYLEIEFVEIYHDQPLFSDIDQFLRSCNFRLFNFYDLYTQPDGQLTAGDAIYVNSKYFG